ncbi:MAG TPA: HAMP domain-containing sensor histidine kinase [Clostridia bacterium]|nr:HAMP domain-containing sensor histidine kinase [Clostridia bacterium]
MMFRKISLIMAFTYGLIIIVTIALLNVILVYTYQENQIAKNEDKYVQYAKIIANIAKDELEDTMTLNGIIRENSRGIEGRVLVLTGEGKVLADNYTYYIGKYVSNTEIIKVLAKEQKAIGYYIEDNRHIMTAVVPIVQNRGSRSLVLISTYVDWLFEDIRELRNQAAIISILAAILAIVLSYVFGKRISGPVEKLTKASEDILNGKLDTKVDIQRADEIGKLAETFNKMSEELYKIDTNRRRFISDVSHELKTPLTSIKALIESLIDGNNEISVYKEYLGDINGEMDRLSLLVKSLLTVTRLEELELKREPVSICAEVESITKLFTPLLKQKDINLEVICAEEVTIFADRGMFREVLINIIDNAIKYGKYNGNIIVNCGKAEKAYLKVSDNGIGIDEKDLPYVFDVFYRADKSRRRDTGGSGIGLYIVRKIIELHGWSISVKSEAKAGTEFLIEFSD